MSYSMNQLYKAVGISKQAIFQYAKRQAMFDAQTHQLLVEAEVLREAHPGCGVEKMYYTLKPDFIGRDRFIELFMDLGFRIKKLKNYKRTTLPALVHYPNLIKGMQVDAPSVIWQSDITYYRVGEAFYYIVFIIDVYTKKIVGFNVSDSMRAVANMKALQMALDKNKAPMIHHSDRGSQYIYGDYIKLLTNHDCKISMALSAQDNAYAERINRTIKEEYLDHWKPNSLEQLKAYVKRAVINYNNIRKHKYLNMMSPVEFENEWETGLLKPVPIITIFDNENNLKPVNSI
jgi:putative transposase